MRAATAAKLITFEDLPILEVSGALSHLWEKNNESMVIAAVPESSRKASIKATKSVCFRYTASDALFPLFEDFRKMCNEAIRMVVKEKPKSRFDLIESAYPRLKQYGLHTHYAVSACEVAFAICRNKNRKSQPFIRQAFLKLDNQAYQLNHMLLRIPTSPRKFIFLKLQGSDYHFSFVDDVGLKRGSVTITPSSVNIAFSKKMEEFEPVGFIGMDINEKNATVSATDGYSHKFRELEDVVEIKERYRDIRAEIARKMKGDKRIAKALLAKYGGREKDRTVSRLHKVTRQIVDYAKEHRLGIKIEKLTGIRKLYRKDNNQGAYFRARMNSWVFGETQRQVEYKSRWDGVPTWYVNPRGTSRNCPDCGSLIVHLADRKLYCQKCDRTWDRDDLASKNIMACAVPQARPSKGSCEGERGDDGSNPRSRWGEGQTNS